MLSDGYEFVEGGAASAKVHCGCCHMPVTFVYAAGGLSWMRCDVYIQSNKRM
jgi:hypothetical protein